MCEELVSYARQLLQITKSCRELCEALLLVSEPGDLALCVALQKACDTYMRSVQQNPPCVAPNYPKEWLAKRALTGILHFQDPLSLAASAVNTAAAIAAQLQEEEAGAGAAAGAMGRFGHGQSVALPVPAAVVTWWDLAATGLRAWYASCRVTFTTTIAP